jgi:formylglycine-generating enzyme required for sulfatase activity
VTLLAAAKASGGSDFAVWALVESLCDNDPAKADRAKIWGAHLAGQTLVESANLARVSERNRAKVDLVQKWLVNILRRNDFPATERALAGNTLAHLGDPRRDVMTIEDMQFCLVSARPFWLGSEESGDEKPLHLNEVLNYDYWLSRFPITNAQFAEFVKAGGYKKADYWREAKVENFWQNEKFKSRYDDQAREKPHDFGAPFNLPNHPVVGITWYEALAFSRWLTEICQNKNWLDAKYSVQLPSEAEWEKAARGGVEIPQNFVTAYLREFSTKTLASYQKNSQFQRCYPWGEQPETNRANYGDTGIGTTSAIGCFSGGASLYGCEEMSGNVWEWTRSLYGDYPYPADEKTRAERENLAASQDESRVLRGGAFNLDGRFARCASRLRRDPFSWDWNFGFRLLVRPL